MTRVDDDGWVPKAKRRKAYRDHQREKFFGEVGLTKLTGLPQISGAPEKSVTRAVDLLGLTAKGSLLGADQKRMVGLAVAALDGLGQGAMGGVAETRQDMSAYSMTHLRKDWFWSPAFFD